MAHHTTEWEKCQEDVVITDRKTGIFCHVKGEYFVGLFISWKQFFVIICINLCKKAPTVKELAEIMGSSHQNVKQILLKLEKKGFVSISVDEQDKRKQRIELTPYCQEFCEKNDERSMNLLKRMFEGVSEEQLQITIQTIIQIEDNLKGI